MKQIFDVMVIVIIAVGLLWFGYSLFFNTSVPALGGSIRRRRNLRPRAEGLPGDPQICPVCSAKLSDGELVRSAAYPSLNGGIDRFMHIRGCVYCLRGDRDRICPVCGTILNEDEILISRLFERPGRRPHVHVIGCSRCKKYK